MKGLCLYWVGSGRSFSQKNVDRVGSDFFVGQVGSGPINLTLGANEVCVEAVVRLEVDRFSIKHFC